MSFPLYRGITRARSKDIAAGVFYHPTGGLELPFLRKEDGLGTNQLPLDVEALVPGDLPDRIQIRFSALYELRCSPLFCFDDFSPKVFIRLHLVNELSKWCLLCHSHPPSKIMVASPKY